MHYAIEFKRLAEKDIRGLSKPVRDRVLQKIETLRADLAGDVKRLTAFSPEYRLRVGDWRVLLDLDGSIIVVHRVLHRSEAYH